MSSKQVLIVGCGYVGQALARLLHAAGHQVFGLSRGNRSQPPWVRPIVADVSQPLNAPLAATTFDWIVYCVAATGYNASSYQQAYCDGVAHLLDNLALHQAGHWQRFLFVSSSSVYAEMAGGWVDEHSQTTQAHFAAASLLAGEQQVLSLPNTLVVRFSGIYGPGRYQRFVQLTHAITAGQPVRPANSPQYLNNIHVDDCAGALAHLLSHPAPEPLYLVSDNQPLDKNDLLDWLGQKLNKAPVATPTPPPPHRVRGAKRCRNTRLLDSGYTLQVPTLFEGLARLGVVS